MDMGPGYIYEQCGPRHNHGQCVISDKYEICFILIPKNMSSTMRNYLKVKMNGYEYNYFKCSEKQKKYFTFCICRDIIKRFYSAINTIFRRKQTDLTGLQNSNLSFYVENKKDEHLVKQVEFIKNIRIDMIINIETISKYFSKSNKSDQSILNKIKINDKTIMDVYEEDIKFYELNKTKCDTDINKFLTIINYEK